MQIGAGLPVSSPLLQIFAGGLSLAVVDPALDVYIGTHPPESLERTAFVRFSHPQPFGARLHQQRGIWFVNSDPGPVTLVDGEGRRQFVPAYNDGPANGGDAGPISIALLAPGLSRLIFGGSEEVFLWVPGRNVNLLSAGSMIDFVSDHERGLRKAAEEMRRQAREERKIMEISLPTTETEQERADRQEWERVSEELRDLESAHASEQPGIISNLLWRAVRMARQRKNGLGTKMGYATPFYEEDMVEAFGQVPKFQPLTDDEYAWALAYARSRS
ncbi:MAG TPA: hypothetical protein VLJ37_12305 [bacterium]|nr:hypothetical protein [bacterium]